MARATLPPSIAILRAITEQTEKIALAFKPGQPDYESFKNLIKSAPIITAQDEFLNSDVHIRKLQLLMCLALSMYGGVSVPSIKQLGYENDELRIVWDSGINDHFIFGKIDDNFKNFSKYFQSRLSSKASGKSEIPSTIFRGVYQFLQSYLMILDATKKRIEPLLKGKSDLLNIIKQPMNKDLLFIILSALPSEQMNSLFIYLQAYLPDDLVVKTPDGNRVNVCSLFETPSTDINFLSEKNKIYLDLYFDGHHPIIKEITQSKTSDYMAKLITNNDFYEMTTRNLQNIITLQIETRIQLYTFYTKYLEGTLSN